jgi:hypothetical protein
MLMINIEEEQEEFRRYADEINTTTGEQQQVIKCHQRIRVVLLII